MEPSSGPDVRQKDAGKPSRWFRSAAILTLLFLLTASFLLLTTSSEDNAQQERGVGLRHGPKSLRNLALQFSCEATGSTNSYCTDNRPTRPFKSFQSWKRTKGLNQRRALDYVSKRDPPPGFERWLEFAQENRCMSGHYTRIEKDLEAFADPNTGVIRIQRHHIEGARSMSNTATFKIVNGVLSVDGVDAGGFQEQFTSLISRFAQHLPDLEFVANLMDEPRVLPGNTTDVDERMGSPVCEDASESFTKYRHLHGFINNRQHGPSYDPNPQLVALFSQTKVNECHRDITYPTLYNLESQLAPHDELNLKAWDQRKGILFFRGTTTGGDFVNASKEGLSHRQRLVKFAKDKELMDIGFTGIIQCEESVCKTMEERYGTKDRVPQMQNFDHKYLMSIDGNSFVSRLPQFMQSASLMFRAGIFDEWFEEWIHEGEHYIRVALDYSDLEAKLQWAVENDAEAREIGLQARDFSKKHLRKEDMECYLFRLLLEYANVLDLGNESNE